MVDPHQKKEILALFEKGVSSAEIAKAMNINPPVIWGIRSHWSRGKYTTDEASSEGIDSPQIISELANGKNPITGEPFPPDHVLQNPTVIRSLFHALKAMEEPQIQKDQIMEMREAVNGVGGKTKKSGPSNRIKCDEVLLEQLVVLRKKLADERDLPAYCIFTNRSLQMMAHDYPTTLEEFEHIYGVGGKRKQDWGKIFISAISDYLKDNPKQHFGLDENPKDEKNPDKTRPTKQGAPWTEKEENQLKAEFKAGLKISDIAEIHGRSYGGIQSRLGRLSLIEIQKTESGFEPVPKPKPETHILKEGERLCNLCGCVIPSERVAAIPDVVYCVDCQSEEESNNPNAMHKKAEEGIGGSRKDWRKNRKGYGGDAH
jgi:hypothetical protein